MQTKSDRAKAALALCYTRYASTNRDIRTLTERIDALWYEAEHHLGLMKQAERDGDAQAVQHCLERVIYFVTRIQAETKTPCA